MEYRSLSTTMMFEVGEGRDALREQPASSPIKQHRQRTTGRDIMSKPSTSNLPIEFGKGDSVYEALRSY